MVRFIKKVNFYRITLSILIVCALLTVYSLKRSQEFLHMKTTRKISTTPNATDAPISSVRYANSSYCMNTKDGTLTTLTNITEVQVAKGNSIFFHETSCESYKRKKITITSRQACSVESAARAHPNSDIYVLYSSPGTFNFNGDESDRFLKAILSYHNVKIMHVDHAIYANGTYVEKLFQKGIVYTSVYMVSHLSDLLRFLTMYKYGGIYLDLDVIVTKDLWRLGPNFSGIEDDYSVAVGIMGFSPDGIGHQVAGVCLRELRDTYDPRGWIDNGPMLLTRVLKRRCQEAKSAGDLANMTNCVGFKVYHRHHFYKSYYTESDSFFDPNKVEEFEKAAEEGDAIHFWNKITFKTKALKTDRVPMVVLAKKFCPRVFSEVDEHF